MASSVATCCQHARLQPQNRLQTSLSRMWHWGPVLRAIRAAHGHSASHRALSPALGPAGCTTACLCMLPDHLRGSCACISQLARLRRHTPRVLVLCQMADRLQVVSVAKPFASVYTIPATIVANVPIGVQACSCPQAANPGMHTLPDRASTTNAPSPSFLRTVIITSLHSQPCCIRKQVSFKTHLPRLC